MLQPLSEENTEENNSEEASDCLIVTVRDSELAIVEDKNSTQEANEAIAKGIDALKEHDEPVHDSQVSNASI